MGSICANQEDDVIEPELTGDYGKIISKSNITLDLIEARFFASDYQEVKQMIIFIRNIPQDTTAQQILDFFQPALIGLFFRPDAEIEKIQIMRVRNKATSKLLFHALVHIHNDSILKRIEKKLNRKKINNRYVNVREYIPIRTWHNDRRQTDIQLKLISNERRSGERRNSEPLDMSLITLPLDRYTDTLHNKAIHRKGLIT